MVGVEKLAEMTFQIALGLFLVNEINGHLGENNRTVR